MNIQTSSSDLYDQLETCITQDDLDGALAVLEDLCRKHSDQAAPWEIRGLLEATAGRPNSAIHYFKRARQYAPLEVWSVRTMALQYVALNQVSIAIETLHSLGMSGQLETSGIRMLSTDLINLGAPELSAEIINNAINQRPDDPLLWHELSAVQSILGKPASVCLQSAEKAIMLSPTTTEFRVTAASILIRMDHLQTAYDLVCHVVTPNRIELDCACCLWRLICLFDTFEDLPRMSICYERLTQVEAAQSQN
jgi:predicted Zn-dependent protease